MSNGYLQLKLNIISHLSHYEVGVCWKLAYADGIALKPTFITVFCVADEQF